MIYSTPEVPDADVVLGSWLLFAEACRGEIGDYGGLKGGGGWTLNQARTDLRSLCIHGPRISSLSPVVAWSQLQSPSCSAGLILEIDLRISLHDPNPTHSTSCRPLKSHVCAASNDANGPKPLDTPTCRQGKSNWGVLASQTVQPFAQHGEDRALVDV